MTTQNPADAAAVTPTNGADTLSDAASPQSPASHLDNAADPSTQKQPPPEKPSDIRRRGAVILSFWLIVGLLGLPIWWYTTTIYRANLPLDEMMEWADGKVCMHLCRCTYSFFYNYTKAIFQYAYVFIAIACVAQVPG